MNNKELISQYVDTGLRLPQYQIEKLSSNEKKTYMRKRMIAIQHTGSLSNYEISLGNYIHN